MGYTQKLGLLAQSVFQDSSLNVGIGAAPSGTYKFEVTGTAKVSGILTLGSTISNGTYTYTLPSATGTLALTSALGDYLPLAGGTLTGALGGTSASFSSTATATAFIPSGATIPTNGMYLSAANTLDFATNTTNRLTITSAGNVGIGVSSPTVIPGVNLIVKALTVAGNGYIQALSSDSGCSVALYSGNDVTDDPAIIYQRSLRFGTSTNSAVTGFSPKMVITNAGNVGIGTSSPSQKLEVSGTDNNNLIMSTSTTGAGGTIRIQANEAASYLVSNNARPLYIQTNSATAMTITSGGSVGIGTSTPTGVTGINLVVKALSAAGNGYIQALSSDSGCSVALYSGNSASDDPSLIYQRNLRFGSATDTATGSYAERMRITSGGEVCIGTTTANYYGLLNLQGSLNSYNVLTIKDTGTTYSSSKYYQLYLNSTDGIAGGVYHATASTVGFYTGPSDQRLKSNIKDWDESVLPFFAAAKPKTYNHTADEDESVVYKGFLAQDMVDNFPEVYGLGADGYYQNNPTAYIPYLVKAIQELSKEVNELKAKLA